MATTDNPMRWVWRGSALAVLFIGWGFILFHNSFHITPPTFFVMLGYAAGVATIYALFNVGASLVSSEDDDTNWEVPAGARGELEREKRTLLKAIKEAEFDHLMGKLSKADVDQMVRTYRLRAIEVIKLLEGSTAETPREQIQREVRARLEVEQVRSKIERAHADLSQRKNKKKAAAAAQAAARAAAAAGATPKVAAAMAAAAAAKTDDEVDDDEADKADDKAEKADDQAVAKAENAGDKAVAKADDKAQGAADDDEDADKNDEVDAAAMKPDAKARSKEATP